MTQTVSSVVIYNGMCCDSLYILKLTSSQVFDSVSSKDVYLTLFSLNCLRAPRFFHIMEKLCNILTFYFIDESRGFFFMFTL